MYKQTYRQFVSKSTRWGSLQLAPDITCYMQDEHCMYSIYRLGTRLCKICTTLRMRPYLMHIDDMYSCSVVPALVELITGCILQPCCCQKMCS